MRGDIAGWWRQAVEQAGAGEQPVLFYRQDRDEWRAVWSLGFFLGADWLTYELTVESGVQAWAAAAREAVAQGQFAAKEIFAPSNSQLRACTSQTPTPRSTTNSAGEPV